MHTYTHTQTNIQHQQKLNLGKQRVFFGIYPGEHSSYIRTISLMYKEVVPVFK